MRERRGQFRLAEQRPRLYLAEVPIEIRHPRITAARLLDTAGHGLRGHKTIARQTDGGLEQFTPGACAVALVGRPQSRHGAGNTRGSRPDHAGILDDRALVVQVHIPASAGRCCFAVVEERRLAVQVDHHEATAAEIAGLRVGDRKHEGSRDGRIDGVATTLDDVHRGVRSVLVGRRHGRARVGRRGAAGRGNGQEQGQRKEAGEAREPEQPHARERCS